MGDKISYKRNYFRIYIWQALSISLGVLSLFIVVPYLSSDKTLYGVFSICTSLTIFFSYADLGVISAGVKYAAEYYIKGDKTNEMKIIGFTAFIMISAFSIVSLVIIVLSIFPKLLIPDIIKESESYLIARQLLLILAISCPLVIGQRILNIVFTIRVEDYIFQRMMIIGNILKIISVLFFFGRGQYKVVEYYIFYQLVTFAVVIGGLMYIRKNGYKITDFLKTIRWDKEIFDKVKKISGTSFVMTICMIMYYELDQIAVSHWIGIEAVAVYGVALSLMGIVRSFSSLVFSPYASRYNHFVGLGDFYGLISFVKKMILMFGLLLTIPIITVSLFAGPFVISWVGNQYIESAMIISIMVFSFCSNFIKDPICSYFVATERNRVLLKSNILLPIVYWAGVFATVWWLGLMSFAIFKFVAPTITAIYYWKLAKNDFKAKGVTFLSIKEVLKPLLGPILLLLLLAYCILPHMFYIHSKMALFSNIFIMSLCLFVTMILGIFTNKILRIEIKNIISPIIFKIHK